MASPPVDIVLKHLKNLTHYAGDSLDRWNNPHFPLIQTFSAIYSYLYERWRDIPVSMKDVLRITNIVPIGHHLARPSRVFFRLSEDLSPFMHELPRVFGAHETFLKEVLILFKFHYDADDVWCLRLVYASGHLRMTMSSFLLSFLQNVTARP